MHEIITLQLGRQSNYVAAHFWNAQVSIKSAAPKGVTITASLPLCRGRSL